MPNKDKKLKNKNMNVKLPENDYEDLQRIADEIGGISLSSMMRMLIYARLDIVKKTGDPKAFLDMNKK